MSKLGGHEKNDLRNLAEKKTNRIPSVRWGLRKIFRVYFAAFAVKISDLVPDLYFAGGQRCLFVNAAVKCSTLLNPAEKAISMTGTVVFRSITSAFFNRTLRRNW